MGISVELCHYGGITSRQMPPLKYFETALNVPFSHFFLAFKKCCSGILGKAKEVLQKPQWNQNVWKEQTAFVHTASILPARRQHVTRATWATIRKFEAPYTALGQGPLLPHPQSKITGTDCSIESTN